MTPQGGGNDSRSKAPPHAGGAADGRAANGKATATGGLHRLHLWQIQAVRDVLVMGLVLGLVWAGYAMRAVTVPLLVALTLAYLFEPPIAALTHRWRASRPLVVGGLLLTVGAAVLVLLTLAVPLIIGQTVRLLDEIREGRFQKTALRLREFVPADYQADFDQAARWFGLPAQDSEVRGQKSAPTSDL